MTPRIPKEPTRSFVSLTSDGGRANARSEHRAAQATPEAPTGLRHTVSIDFRGSHCVIDNPRLVTTRTHRPPVARGHRCFVLGKAVWR